MKTLVDQIETMRTQFNESAGSDRALVRSLGETMSQADAVLLHDIRVVAAEHANRRRLILDELRKLVASFEPLPNLPEPFSVLNGQFNERPLYDTTPPALSLKQPDWPNSTANIRDELNFFSQNSHIDSRH